VLHLGDVVGEQLEGVGVGRTSLELGEGGLEQVDLGVDLLLLAFVEALALVGSLGRESLSGGGEEGGHAGEVAAGLPVFPADGAEGEAAGVVEGEEEEPAAVFLEEPPIGVIAPPPALLANGRGRHPLH
jgi:hypothetical protein